MPSFEEVQAAVKVRDEAARIVMNCPHEIQPADSFIKMKLLKDKWACTSAICPHCKRYFGWWCPESASGLCDYKKDDGTYDDDDCRYCHMPSERK